MFKNNFDDSTGAPLIKVEASDLNDINLYIKYEGDNPTGSVKDRAAKYIIDKLLETGEINPNTIIIESSSGNFGIALSRYCQKSGLKCIIVVDPNILPINESLILAYGSKLVKVTEPDKTGGYLLTRTKYIQELVESNKNYYWINQYENPYIAEAYYNTLGAEICNNIKVDYVFLGVSSGGTITGLSRKIREVYPRAVIVAVDTAGSIIFDKFAKKRYIPGIGSSMTPPILKKAFIDDIVMVEESEAVKFCHSFHKKFHVLIGGSSGSVLAAIAQYVKKHNIANHSNIIALFADRGERYVSTIYNNEWVKAHNL